MSRILVVDDNADNRYSFRLMLNGYDVVEASTGTDAIELARTRDPDCILLDVQMPGMDGFEVCRRLREEDRTRSIPIILVTAHHRDTESVVRGLAAGGDDYVTKPVASEELLARVRAMLRIRELQDRLEKLNAELESEVRRRTAELQQIYSTVPVGIYQLDATGRIVYANPFLLRLLGYEGEDVVGKSVAWMFSEGYDTLYWLDLCRREGRVASEHVVRSKSGRVLSVFDERVVNLDEVGEPTGFTGYLQDLSERNRIRRILADQEEQAGIGRLAAGIVHEIANPINGVQQYLDVLHRRLESGESLTADEIGTGLQVMRDALDRTTELLKHLRGVARGVRKPHGEVDVLGLLHDLHTLMRHDLHRRGIEMEVVGEPTSVRGDPGRLSQVFLNLITNARDAMPDGGTLRAEVAAQDSTVLVRFRDTGAGIASEHLARIFEYFYTTKGEEGTGYGLAVSLEIVEEHGGAIDVESEPGRGSVFTVRLPALRSPACKGGTT